MNNNEKQLKDNEARSVSLGRHKSQCSICNHPNCSEIEECWIDWRHICHIESVYHVSRDAIYRHMHALDLFKERQRNIRGALERIIEEVGAVSPSASGVVSAIQAYVKLNSAEQATEQAQGMNPQKLLERMSQEEREAFARDGSLPGWFSRAIGATSSDGQEGEKESQVTETKRVQ
jgi:hypothetical protein